MARYQYRLVYRVLRRLRWLIFIFLIIISILLIGTLLITSTSLEMFIISYQWKGFKRENYILVDFGPMNGIDDTCILPSSSAWNSKIMEYTDLYWERKAATCPVPKEKAYLEGQILRSKAGYNCKGRCIRYDMDIKFGEWLKEGSKFDCDFVESRCWPKKYFDFFPPHSGQSSILSQIIERSSSRNFDAKHYSVYVILLDSTSFHHSRRNIPKTLFFLNKEMKAVEFRYVNKLGKNSYPNAIALWYGKMVEKIEKKMLRGQNSTAAEWQNSCNKAIHIMDEAKEYGYKTMLADYWFGSELRDSSNSCVSYTSKHRPDHEAPPLVNSSIFRLVSMSSECVRTRTTFLQELQYYAKFTRSYKGSPKFAWLWISYGSHDSQQESMILDTELYDFFIKNKHELDSSFVFLMGDHGLRFGEHMTSSEGEYENKNPFLTISVPAELREKQLMENLRRNSKHLQTHFDTRATLLDIIKYQPKTNFSSVERRMFNGENGSSYLREQPGHRTCHTLPIPFQYCSCQYKMEKIDSSTSIGNTVAMFTLDYINGVIIENGLTAICSRWKMVSAEIEGYYPIRQTGTFRVLLKARPQGLKEAFFRALVQVKPNGRLEMVHYIRVDSTGPFSTCITEYCGCNLFQLNLNMFYYYLSLFFSILYGDDR